MKKQLPRNTWFALTMIALLATLLAFVALDLAPKAPKRATVAAASKPSPTQTGIPPTTAPPTLPPTLSPTLTRTLTPSPVPTSQPSPTLTATLAPSPTATPEQLEPQDHYWFLRPVDTDYHDRVSRVYPYGSRLDGSYPIHHGVEFVNPMGTPLRAVADGVVEVVGGDQTTVYGARDDYYGQLIVLRLNAQLDGEPLYALYGHISEALVEVGEPVVAGQVIGLVGMAGVAEGPHLHFEVRIGGNDYGNTVNPELWVEPLPGRGTLAGVVRGADGNPIDTELRLVLSTPENPGQWRYDVVTYPASQVNPDPVWGENFGIGDLTVGDWVVSAFVNGGLIEQVVTIREGETTWLELPPE